MSVSCNTCVQRKTCKQICPEVEKLLKAIVSKRKNWERLVDPQKLDKVNWEEKQKEGRKMPIIYNDNYDRG